MRYPLLLSTFFLSVLAGCGGSSGHRGSPNPTPPQSTLESGVFDPYPISGLRYETATHSGTTNAAGEFEYAAGETVTFYIGEMMLGSTEGAETITLFDVAGAEQPEDYTAYVNNGAIYPPRAPLYNARSMIVFLHTLDEDYDVTNGVQITPEVAARAAASNVNLNTNFITHLINDRLTRQLIYQANTAGELTPRPIKHTGLALAAHLDFPVPLGGLWSHDSNGDGTADRSSRDVYTALGKKAEIYIDDNADGDANYVIFWEWNDNQQRLRERLDTDGDGNIDQTTTWVYNEFGTPIQETRTDGTGTIERDQVRVYDDQGALVQRITTESSGTVDTETWLYVDGIRNTYEVDDATDGVVDRRDVFEFNERGEWIRREKDLDGDGFIDEIEVREYDEYHNLSYVAFDRDADGTSFEDESFYTYDEFENLVERRAFRDGGLIRINEIEFDANALRVAEYSDSDADGTWDSVVRYERNDAGYVVERITDGDNDGVPEYSTSYELNERGQRLRETFDGDGLDRQYIFEYDGDRLLSRSTDLSENLSFDGVFEEVTTYSNYIDGTVAALH